MRGAKLLTILSSLFLAQAFAVDPYKLKPQGMKPICDKSYVEVGNLPPVMDQGQYGLCYAHSSLLLLEHLRCSKSPNPSSCYSHKGSVLHLARFNSTYEDTIPIGGDPGSVLSTFHYKGRKLATSACAPYEKWKELDNKHKDEIKTLVVPRDGSGEYDFFYYLWTQLKKDSSYDARLCWANEIMDTGLNQNVQDLMAVLDKSNEMSWQELRYKILVPKSCLEKTINYPDYQLTSYPRNSRDKKDFKSIRDQIYRSLSKGYPVEASFCAQTNSNGECGYHSASIVGQRHVCDRSNCKLQFRIQNSYGQSWQRYNDNGWVDGENLTKLMADRSMGLTIITPKGEALDNGQVSPFYTSSPVDRKARSATHSSGESCWKVDPASVQNNPNALPEQDEAIVKPSRPRIPGKIYHCKKDGKNIFTDNPSPDMKCKDY
jgi:hypothetical protein